MKRDLLRLERGSFAGIISGLDVPFYAVVVAMAFALCRLSPRATASSRADVLRSSTVRSKESGQLHRWIRAKKRTF